VVVVVGAADAHLAVLRPAATHSSPPFERPVYRRPG
jgi:hypothetical protein